MTRRDVLRQRRQVAALRAYIETGSIKGAAHRLGVDESSVRRRLEAYCTERQVALPQAIFDFGRDQQNA